MRCQPPLTSLGHFPDLASWPSCQFQSLTWRTRESSDCALNRLYTSRLAAVNRSTVLNKTGLESKPCVFKTLFKESWDENQDTESKYTSQQASLVVSDHLHLQSLDRFWGPLSYVATLCQVPCPFPAPQPPWLPTLTVTYAPAVALDWLPSQPTLGMSLSFSDHPLTLFVYCHRALWFPVHCWILE